MYSPRIRDDLIPKLWHLAKTRKVPMTQLVNEFLEEALATEDASETKEDCEQYPVEKGGET